MASGDTLGVFLPLANEPPTANYATLDIRNAQPVLDFDASTDESAIFSDVMPRHYATGGIVASIAWAATSATAGNVVWLGAFERQNASQDLDSDSFSSAISATGTASATNGAPTYTEITFTTGQIDGIQVGERYRLKLTRDADVAGDTMTGDAELLGVELREA